MSESVVRVDLRQANLSESAKLREADDAVFLALDAPPPVRSILRITEGENVRAFEVGRVIEVADDSEPTRGCYGSFVDDARLDDQAKVGSEHLEPGISNSGVPAPVVVMNTADMMLGEVGEEGEAAAAAAAEAEGDAPAAEGDAAEGGDDAPAEGGDDAPAEGGDAEASEGGDDAPAEGSEDEPSADE